jgi:hypothetical protein
MEITSEFDDVWNKMMNTFEDYKADESFKDDITSHNIVHKITNHLTEHVKDSNSIEGRGFNDLKKEVEKLIKDFLIPPAASPSSSVIASPSTPTETK